MESTNGAVDAQDRRVGGAGDQLLADRDPTLAAAVRAAHERDLIAAVDRDQASVARRQTLGDLGALARQLALAALDPLTGARTRAAGLAELDRELARCRRLNFLLVVACVDVVGLKAVNDAAGHAAGDELIKRVALRIAERLRPYDLIVRLGGDEFLCAMSNMSLTGARARFDSVIAELAGAAKPAAISVGFAELAATDTASDLIARADNELTESRQANRRSRSGGSAEELASISRTDEPG